MNWITFKYHAKRLLRMIGYRGIGYTARYLFIVAFYNVEFLQKLFLTKLYPWFVFYPRYVEVEITTRCNLLCTMCEHTYWDEKSMDMSLEQFKRVVDEFPKLKYIGLTGIGSSFLNKDFLKMCEYVKSKGLYSEVYDTFLYTDEKVAKELIRIGMDRLIASVDGATKETYEKIRVASDFDEVISNVRSLVKLKKETGAKYPEITFHYIVMKDNVNEIVPFIDLVHSIMEGEDAAVFYTALLHPFKEVEHMASGVPDDIIEEAEKKARALGVKIAWNKNITEKEPISNCTEWTTPFIHVDGTVIPCCAGNEANARQFQRTTSMGNIFEKTFKEIWYGERYKKLRDDLHDGKVPPACVNCTIYDIKEKPSDR
ncbi:MAG: radical SAM protein [Thermodesulfobacteriota bacterium]